MKKSVICVSVIISVLSSGVYSPLFAEEKIPSKYTEQIDSCRDKRDKGLAKTEERYVCPVGTLDLQQIAFQVIMSLEFNEIDKEVKTDLETIRDKTNKDIGQLATNVRDLFDTTKGNAKYPVRYREVCNSVVMYETNLYFQEKGETSPLRSTVTTDNSAKDFVFWWQGCNALVDKKLQAYKDAVWLLGESAVVKSFQNDKHSYMRKLKDHYEKFLNKWTTYIGQLGVIKDKWPSKTKNVQ